MNGRDLIIKMRDKSFINYDSKDHCIYITLTVVCNYKTHSKMKSTTHGRLIGHSKHIII